MALDDELSSLLSSTGLVLLASIAGAVAKLVERVVIVRALSQDAWGEVSLGIALLTLSTTIAVVGFGQGIPRYVSRFDDERDVRGVWVSGLLIAVVASLAVVAALLGNVERVAALLFERPDSPLLVQLFVVAVPLVVLMRIAVGGIRGLENTTFKAAVSLFYPAARIGLVVLLFWAGYDVLAPGIAYVVAAGLSAALAYLLFTRIFTLVGPVRLHTRELVAFSVPIVLSSFITMLLTRTDTIMLGYFRASDEVGLYTAMFPLATGMSLIIASFGYLYLPMASRLDANDKREEMGRIYRIGTKWVFVLTFPLFLVFVAFPGDVLALVYGEAYRRAALAFVVLSVGTLSTVMFGRVQETLSALGHTVHIMLANLAAYVVNVALNLVLIPQFSYLGAAVTSALSFFLLNALVYGVVRLRFDLTPFRATTLRTFAVLLLGLLPAALLVARWVSVTLVTLVPALVAAGLATVGAVALTGCLEPEDRIVIDAVEEQVGVRVPLIHRYLPE